MAFDISFSSDSERVLCMFGWMFASRSSCISTFNTFHKNTQKYNLLASSSSSLLVACFGRRSLRVYVSPKNLNGASHSTNFGFIFFSVWNQQQQQPKENEKKKKIECQTAPNRNRQNSFHIEIYSVDFHFSLHTCTTGNNTTEMFDDMRAAYIFLVPNQTKNCLFIFENIIIEWKTKKTQRLWN